MFLELKNKTEDKTEQDQTPITVAEMVAAEQQAIANGASPYDMMLTAGQAVANVVHDHYPDKPVTLLCGPGNNGGDGYVAALFLQDMGYDVTVYGISKPRHMTGPAKKAADEWKKRGAIKRFDAFTPPQDGVIVDAVFGVGLSKPIDGLVKSVFETIKNTAIVAVDIPSGMNGDTGAVDSATLKAEYTVTFHRPKHGMTQAKGPIFCGEISIHDVGI